MTIKSNFSETVSALKTMQLSHYWFGVGSTIFFEFGKLTETVRRDGSPGHPDGEICVGIEWDWRVQNQKTILFGSSDEEVSWTQGFQKLIGTKPLDLKLYGDIPEITLIFENGLKVLSFMTSDGDPEWMIIDKRASANRAFGVKSGALDQE